MGQWYKDFVTKCPDTEAKIDYSALHFYNTWVSSLDEPCKCRPADVTTLLLAAIPMRSSPTSRPSTARVSLSLPLQQQAAKLTNSPL